MNINKGKDIVLEHYKDYIKEEGLLREIDGYEKEVVIMCVGTDKVAGDSLGPMVGTMLEETDKLEVVIKGTLEKPIHMINIKGEVEKIKKEYKDPYIVVVKSVLGESENIGKVCKGKGATTFPEEVGREYKVGDMYLLGIVNIGGYREKEMMQTTSIHTVYSMAREIVNHIEK